MVFNKTELALLAEAARNGGWVGVDHGYQGPSGRKRAFGVRRQQAACSLRKKGLLVRVHADGGTPLYSKTGWGINGWAYSSSWKLVSALTADEAIRTASGQ